MSDLDADTHRAATVRAQLDALHADIARLTRDRYDLHIEVARLKAERDAESQALADQASAHNAEVARLRGTA